MAVLSCGERNLFLGHARGVASPVSAQPQMRCLGGHDALPKLPIARKRLPK
jgi:hypothetical protein